MHYQAITRNREYVRAYTKGTALVHPYVVVYACKNKYRTIRVGLTASKKVGNAVRRNRARRVMREALFQQPPLKKGYDIVLVARTATAGIKSTALAPVLHRLLQKAALLQEDKP